MRMAVPATQAEYEAYIAVPENWAYLLSDELNSLCLEFEARRDAGEKITVAEAAEFLRLPINIFRHLYGHYLAFTYGEMGSPPSRSVN
jgi:hypothetical protein